MKGSLLIAAHAHTFLIVRAPYLIMATTILIMTDSFLIMRGPSLL